MTEVNLNWIASFIWGISDDMDVLVELDDVDAGADVTEDDPEVVIE